MSDADEPDGGDGAPGNGDGEETAPADTGGEDDDTRASRDDLPPVPEDPEAAVAADDHALPPEDLNYPTLELGEGSVGDDGSVDGRRDLDREEMAAWLEDLAGGLASHDVAVEAPDGRVTFGVAPGGADVSFDPDAGELAVTFRLRAKPMVVADPDDPQVGARGGKGFVPLAMLTGDADPGEFRCYNWVDEPTDG